MKKLIIGLGFLGAIGIMALSQQKPYTIQELCQAEHSVEAQQQKCELDKIAELASKQGY